MAVDQEHSSIPLLSRLDHLDFMMKYMEGKGASMAEWEERGNGGRRESGEKEWKLMPMDLALQQTLFKGSLLDRVASLENRLFQLCLELDYGRVPCSTQTSGSSSSSYRSMAGPSSSSSSSSYPIFNLTPHGHKQSHAHPNLETDDKEKSDGEKGKDKNGSPRNQKKKKKKKIKMSDRSLKKLIPWPHLKILGC